MTLHTERLSSFIVHVAVQSMWCSVILVAKSVVGVETDFSHVRFVETQVKLKGK